MERTNRGGERQLERNRDKGGPAEKSGASGPKRAEEVRGPEAWMERRPIQDHSKNQGSSATQEVTWAARAETEEQGRSTAPKPNRYSKRRADVCHGVCSCVGSSLAEFTSEMTRIPPKMSAFHSHNIKLPIGTIIESCQHWRRQHADPKNDSVSVCGWPHGQSGSKRVAERESTYGIPLLFGLGRPLRPSSFSQLPPPLPPRFIVLFGRLSCSRYVVFLLTLRLRVRIRRHLLLPRRLRVSRTIRSIWLC